MTSKEDKKHELSKKKAHSVCYECQRTAYAKYECHLLKKNRSSKKKAFVATWSDKDITGDENEEVANLFLMVIQEDSKGFCSAMVKPNVNKVVRLLALNSGSEIKPDRPYAEFWMGTHDLGPSFIADDNGESQGSSLIICVGILIGYTDTMYEMLTLLSGTAVSWWSYMLAVLGVFTVVTMWAVIVTEGCRKIKLQYYRFKLASAAREDTPITEVELYIPFNINPSGMQHVLTTTYLLAFPSIVASILGSPLWEHVKEISNPTTSVGAEPWVYYSIYAFFVFLFNIFDIANLPKEIAYYLNKMGAMIPNIKPGKATIEYLSKVGDGKEEYMDDDIDDILKEWVSYVVHPNLVHVFFANVILIHAQGNEGIIVGIELPNLDDIKEEEDEIEDPLVPLPQDEISMKTMYDYMVQNFRDIHAHMATIDHRLDSFGSSMDCRLDALENGIHLMCHHLMPLSPSSLPPEY
ncbi:Preprotein translocase subunit SCY2 [Hibiscus syriacus]|uniref:Preprotein translocase subunit SCY2 n=1 Tax=Hibiscus syriacus TaxID=106335 RepID=A0A6A3BS38_HIBSY|nr:Preprotein translocase subunit SCY2 [Hibiscus syriacus]